MLIHVSYKFVTMRMQTIAIIYVLGFSCFVTLWLHCSTFCYKLLHLHVKKVTTNLEVCIGLPTSAMHKNRLQEYAQKLSIPLPVYETINKGFPHAPKFKSFVLVNGKRYLS